MSRIPGGDLPKTFQDAIIFARSLGIDFIWIDSFCIVQDDEIDWARESAEMSSIYQNSFITIAATKSEDHDGGCFSEMAAKYQAQEVAALDSTNQHVQVYSRSRLPHPNWSGKKPRNRISSTHSRLSLPRALTFSSRPPFSSQRNHVGVQRIDRLCVSSGNNS
jgi:Heterokaryon incompatibility protein (HET)